MTDKLHVSDKSLKCLKKLYYPFQQLGNSYLPKSSSADDIEKEMNNLHYEFIPHYFITVEEAKSYLTYKVCYRPTNREVAEWLYKDHQVLFHIQSDYTDVLNLDYSYPSFGEFTVFRYDGTELDVLQNAIEVELDTIVRKRNLVV